MHARKQRLFRFMTQRSFRTRHRRCSFRTIGTTRKRSWCCGPNWTGRDCRAGWTLGRWAAGTTSTTRQENQDDAFNSVALCVCKREYCSLCWVLFPSCRSTRESASAGWCSAASPLATPSRPPVARSSACRTCSTSRSSRSWWRRRRGRRPASVYQIPGAGLP